MFFGKILESILKTKFYKMMKKITLSIIASVCFLFSSAQYEPDTKFLQELIWQQVMPHDSLVWSSDSGANFSPDEQVSMTLFPDGQIDFLAVYDPNLSYSFDGTRNGNLTRIYGIDLPSSDTNSRYDFFKNVLGQDSILEIYYDDGSGNLNLDIAFEFVYNPSGAPTNFYVLVDVFGTGSYTKVNDYKFHYNSGRLDSVTIETLFPGGMEGKLESTYDASGRLVQFDFYEIDGNDELIPSDRYFFKHNAQGLINEVIELYYDQDSTAFILSSSWKYFQKQNSTISAPEQLKKGELVVYPNPAKDEIRISSKENYSEFSIMSLTGQIVKQGQFNTKIDVSELKKGIYLLSLKSKGDTEIRKFQKL
tara:strand:+ start:137604 stop:138695 length:1092 start_codon:yes stop_codon:yes gene_type:complete